MTFPIVGFLGMTHLGINSAVASAEKGFQTLCFDFDPAVIQELSTYKTSIMEPQLSDLLVKNRDKISFTTKTTDLEKCDLIYISPDVPTDDSGMSNLEPVYNYLNHLKNSLESKPIIIILSQVHPGFTRPMDYPKDKLFYQVETLIFGRAIERATLPERIIIGCNDPKLPLPKSYLDFLKSFNCPLLPMSYESAELTKISINMFLISSVTTTNVIAEICEKSGANWFEIELALRLDKRIGQHAYLTPGLGISGGNLERDMATIYTMAENSGTEISLVKSWRKNSAYRKNWVLRVLQNEVLSKISNPKIGILGLSYKKNTNSIKNSPSLTLIKNLRKYEFLAYDPVVKMSKVLFPNVDCKNSISEVYKDVDVVLLMTPWDEFSSMNTKELCEKMKEKVIIDPFGVLKNKIQTGVHYWSLGVKS